jgi:hypothetical protein
MQITPSRQKASTLFLLVWAILCVLFFIGVPGKVSYVQWSNLELWQLLAAKLGRLSPASDLFNLLRSFTGMVIFSLACTSLGAFVTEKLKIPNISLPSNVHAGLASLATAFLIGNGIFSLIFLVLSGLFQLTPAYVILLLLIGGLLGVRQMKTSVPEMVSGLLSRFRELFENPQTRFIVFLCTAILSFSLFYSTARISYDSSAIYFSNAKLTALNNHIQFFTGDSFIVSAFHSSILYTALIQVFGDQSARMFSWICGVVFIIFAMAISRKIGASRHGTLILVTLLLASTALLDLMGDGKIDILTSGYAIAAVYWMLVGSQDNTPIKSISLLIGFLIGFAMIARPFNVFILGVFTAAFYLQRVYLRKGFEPLDPRLLINSFIYIGAGAIGLGIYHLFANWMIQGNPFAFLTSISKINPSAGPWDYNPDQILAIRLLYPFVATFYNSPQTLGNISPLFVAFLPALLIHDIRKQVSLSSELKVLFVISLVTLFAWIFLFFTVYEIRYVLFLWAILFIPVAEVIAVMLENKNMALRQLFHALIVMLLIFVLVRTVYISLDTYSAIDENGNPQCFCDSLTPINEAASEGDRVLTLSAFRYYLRSDLFACSTKHDEYRILSHAAKIDAESFWQETYRQGYKFIAFEVEYTIKHLELGIIPSPENAPDWLELEPLYTGPGGTHIAYRIDAKNPPVSADASCKMNDSGIWQVDYNK